MLETPPSLERPARHFVILLFFVSRRRDVLICRDTRTGLRKHLRFEFDGFIWQFHVVTVSILRFHATVQQYITLKTTYPLDEFPSRFSPKQGGYTQRKCEFWIAYRRDFSMGESPCICTVPVVQEISLETRPRGVLSYALYGNYNGAIRRFRFRGFIWRFQMTVSFDVAVRRFQLTVSNRNLRYRFRFLRGSQLPREVLELLAVLEFGILYP